MIKIIEKKDCCGCYACYNVCPQNCIEFKKDNEGFLYPVVDETKCVNCDLCTKVCPIENKKETINDLHLAFACNNCNLSVRLNSSSGGVFFSLAKYVIESDGVVYGASFDKNINLIVTRVENEHEISPLMGAKYVQAEVGKIYQSIKVDLISGKLVMFVGTSCQIAGLNNFLRGQTYENLIMVDFVCHGVPSPGVWQSFLKYREKKMRSKMVKAEFRNKSVSWRQYCAVFSYQNGKQEKIHRSDNPYQQSFLKNYILRPSCYDCKFKGTERISDMTIGDFWTIKQYVKELDDKKGTSLVLIHSQKGMDIFDIIKRNMQFVKVNHDDVVLSNSPYLKSVECPDNRFEFFNAIETIGWDGIKKGWFPERKFMDKIKDYLRSKR